MISKEITFVDVDDNSVTESWLFHLSMDELTDMAADDKDYGDYLLQIAKEKEPIKLIQTMRTIVRLAVGKREGRGIVKSEAITADFFGCGAWEELYVELLTNEDVAAEFFNRIAPIDYIKRVNASMAAEKKEYTDKELLEMSDEKFASFAGDDPKNMTQHHLQIAFQRKERALAAKSAA